MQREKISVPFPGPKISLQGALLFRFVFWSLLLQLLVMHCGRSSRYCQEFSKLFDLAPV